MTTELICALKRYLVAQCSSTAAAEEVKDRIVCYFIKAAHRFPRRSGAGGGGEGGGRRRRLGHCHRMRNSSGPRRQWQEGRRRRKSSFGHRSPSK